MSIYRSESVIVVTNGSSQIDELCNIRYIKCINAQCTIKAGNSSGTVIYKSDSTNNYDRDEVTIRTKGMYVTATTGAVYIYLSAK